MIFSCKFRFHRNSHQIRQVFIAALRLMRGKGVGVRGARKGVRVRRINQGEIRGRLPRSIVRPRTRTQATHPTLAAPSLARNERSTVDAVYSGRIAQQISDSTGPGAAHRTIRAIASPTVTALAVSYSRRVTGGWVWRGRAVCSPTAGKGGLLRHSSGTGGQAARGFPQTETKPFTGRAKAGTLCG